PAMDVLLATPDRAAQGEPWDVPPPTADLATAPESDAPPPDAAAPTPDLAPPPPDVPHDGDAVGSVDPRCRPPAATPPGFELLDDMEDLDLALSPVSGRTGSWSAETDETEGTQAPSPFAVTELPGCPAGRGYLHVSGNGFSEW